MTPEKSFNDLFSLDELDNEINHRKRKKDNLSLLKTIINSIIVVAAVAVLIANLVFPIMRVNGTSMEPIMSDGDIITSVKGIWLIERGDIIAFYYNDKVLLKRVIGLPGDVVDIDGDGYVYLNKEKINEPYLNQRSLGICDVDFPVTVEENTVFVLGDHRSVSVDSRSRDVGNINYERIIGKIFFRLYPFSKFGLFDSQKPDN